MFNLTLNPMKKIVSSLTFFLFLSLLSNFFKVSAQENIGWLSDYTSAIEDGSDTYQYSFTSVDGNNCKIKVVEQKTDKKGKTSSMSYVFYLSDIDPAALSFKPSGKTIDINLETKMSQKFITVTKDGEFDGYTNSFSVITNEVDKARSFIDAVKSNIGNCKETNKAWSSPQEAFDWLINNIGESTSSGKTYKQEFTKGSKSYMAQLLSDVTDSKGNQQKTQYVFDLSDINPAGIELVVSGKSLKIDLPVRDNKYFIQVKDDNGISYAKDMEIYTDDIETARNIVNAFNALVSGTKPVRNEWTGYTQALSYVKDNLKTVASGSDSYAQSLEFSDSPSGSVSFKSVKTDSKGASEEELSTFYMNDILPQADLKVSSRNAYIELNTKDKNRYIHVTVDGNLQSYNNSIRIYVEDIDNARDMVNALEYAAKNSKEGIQSFGTLESIKDWLKKNPGEVTIDNKKYQQSITVSSGADNKLIFSVTTVEEGSADEKEQFEIYPADLSKEDLQINVSGKKLYVTLSTGKLRYIKAFKDDQLQNYTSSADVLFANVLNAKDFVAAMQTLLNMSKQENQSMQDNNAAWAYLTENLGKIEIDGNIYEQKIEKQEDNSCKIKFTRTETDSKGSTTEYVYELSASDIDPANSGISVRGKELSVDLVTKGKQKLIKPYKDGEAGNFDSDMNIISDDVLTAKKILAALTTLSNNCK